MKCSPSVISRPPPSTGSRVQWSGGTNGCAITYSTKSTGAFSDVRSVSTSGE